MPLFSRLFPGLENWFVNFQTFSRIQDSVDIIALDTSVDKCKIEEPRNLKTWKITSKLCVVVSKRGEKTPIAMMLENYCQINVTTENVSQYICVCWKKNLQTIVSKVDNFREKWMGKDNLNLEQPFRVKRMLSGADVEQQSDKRTSLSEKVG